VRTVGVYNRYWTTTGGAETYGAALAQVLARTDAVELIGPDEVDVDDLARRLRLDLGGVTYRRVHDRPGAVTAASEDYDLFVNVSFLSAAPSRAERSLYVVHFPAEIDADLTWAHRLAMRTAGRLVRGANPVDTAWGEGFYPREGGRPRYFWTNGDARFMVTTSRSDKVDVRLVFARQRPDGMDPVEVAVEVDGETAAELTLKPGGSPLQRRRGIPVVVTVPATEQVREAEIRIRTETFVPADAGGDDDRELGVALTALHTGIRVRERLGAQLGAWFPVLYRDPGGHAFLDTYDHVVCNSEFTRGWLQQWWQHDGDVLYPPVSMHERATKDPVILAVGRFFASGRGHSKKQLELVEAFKGLLDAGVEGWTLHLVGGCSEADQPYLDEVRQAAEGLPIEFHVNAPGDELERLFGRASIFWHATGYGEDAESAPQRLEHFGIATVEAMSAGVVPIVIGLAGQLEIVEDGKSGYHFRTLDELVEKTRAVIDDPAELARLSEAAEKRAEHFDHDSFALRLEAILSDSA
jgi:glycosyltransferase involved in cell wall biosynthesis